MSSHSDRMIREQELGCTFGTNKVICAECMEDPALIEVITAHPEKGPCGFCGQKRSFVGSFEAVLEHMAEALNLDYSIPEEELFYDNESETGWAGEVFDSREVLYEINFDLSNPAVIDAIVEAFSDRQFCYVDYGLMRPNERLKAGWDRFKQAVRHQRRYTFWSVRADTDLIHPDDLPVGEMLHELDEVLRNAGVTTVVERGAGFWRVRTHSAGTQYTKDADLSAPPISKANKPNRMSPSGISMFYGSEDLLTACMELVDPVKDADSAVSYGRFIACRELRLLDLADLPELPSYFDLSQRATRLAIEFLREFSNDLSAPVDSENHGHIEYVPTQAFTEYVRFEMKADGTLPYDGIRYRSSRNAKPCVVLFCGQSECLREGDGAKGQQWLELDSASVATKTVKELNLPEGSENRRPKQVSR